MEKQEQKPKKKFYKQWWFWLIAILVILTIIGSSGNNPEKVGSSNPDNQTTGSTNFKVGDNVKMGNSIITINKVEYSQGGKYTKPNDGNEWLNLNLTIENTGSSQQYITTLGQMFVPDGDKNSYQVSVTDRIFENPGFGLDGQIIAQSKRTGWVGFEIPKTAKGLQFQYNGSMFGGGTIIIDLGR
ncbi:MAG: DUF4352 domain-containing protein [Candidatus Pacebacteria bacterium]|nr:DUF4352 domain-containing protein [Candidatus Paceibacterota bacterium]